MKHYSINVFSHYAHIEYFIKDNKGRILGQSGEFNYCGLSPTEDLTSSKVECKTDYVMTFETKEDANEYIKLLLRKKKILNINNYE
jgi:hypothetical protein